MRRTVTCPKCGNSMQVDIWSETLAQVLKCSSCGHTFTYDPAKEKEKKEVASEPEPSLLEGLTLSGIIEKGKELAISSLYSMKKETKEILGYSLESSEREKVEKTTREVRCPYCGKMFRAALPANDKAVLTTKCPDCNKVFTFLREEPTKEKEREEENPEKNAPTEEWDSIILLQEASDKKERDVKKGMITVICPQCGESFETIPPERKGKVSCPICEHYFEINSRGEYIAKKAEKNLLVKEAIAVRKRVINEAEAGIKDIKEGLYILLQPEILKKRLHLYSGIAGILLLFTALLGFAYSGALFLMLGDLHDGKPSGTASVSGEVICGGDTIEGANVNLTDMGLHTTTNSEGSFRFEDIPAGEHTLRISAPEKGTLTIKFNIGDSAIRRKNLDLVLELPENGSATKDLREKREENALMVNGLMAGFVVLASLLTLYAGLLSLSGKRFRRTLFLSGAGVLTFGFLVGSAVAISAMLLIILGRKEFE